MRLFSMSQATEVKSKSSERADASTAKPPKKRSRCARWAAICAVVLACALGATSAWAYNYYSTSFEWYTKDPSAATFTIRTAGELEALSAIVNGDAPADPDGDGDTDFTGAVNLEGKTIELSGNINLLGSLRNLEFTPIGKSEDCAFAGTFDGKGFQISGLKISTAGAQNVGLFGVVSTSGSLKNVNIASTMSGKSEITVSSAKDTVAHIGSLAGWCKGAMENCTSAAAVNVSWNDSAQGADRTQAIVAENIGGLVGICDGNLATSSFSGTLTVDTAANAITDADGEADPYVARNIGGVAGRTGGVDWADAGVETANANPSALTGCSNTGSVTVYTVGAGGKDRFGETVEAKSSNVGGVAGYAGGNVSTCKNTGDVLATGYKGEGDPFTTWSDGESRDSYEDTAGGGVKVGGIVGSLRSGASGSASSGNKDAGVVAKQAGVDPYITLDDCTNTGYVSGLNAVGGIVGTAGTFTTITHCVNGNPDLDSSVVKGSGYVRTTRWNKPNGGGIAGQSLGTISWSRNHAPVINTKIGYYCGGIAGALFDYDEAGVRVSDMPEIYGCYNTGQVTSWSSGAILGENNGYVHDCVALKDTDPNNTLVYATSWAIVDNCVVAFATQAEADKATQAEIEAFGGKMALASGSALSILNTQSLSDGYDGNYYFIPLGTEKGWPVLDGEDYQRNAYDLSALQVELECDGQAAYSLAHDAVPSVTARAFVDGSWVELVPNVDFYVKADPAASGKTVGDTQYQASVCGMGNYTGSVTSSKLSYRIVKGDLSQCTVVATSVAYNRHAQNNPSVVLLDSGKEQVDSSQYRIVSVNNGADCIEPSSSYKVVVEATEGSNYTGQVTGDYAITKVNSIKECDLIGFVWQNRVWYYDEDKSSPYEVNPVLDSDGNLVYENGRPKVEGEVIIPASEGGRVSVNATPKYTNEDGTTKYGMAIEYTGASIEPGVIGVLWQYDYVDEATGKTCTATELLSSPKDVDGVSTDFRTLYGVSATPSTGIQYPNVNIGENTGGITVAYGRSLHFHNYWVSQFDITSSVVYDLSNASVSRYGDYVNYVADDKEPKVPALDVLVGGREVTVYEDYQYQVVKTTDAEGNVDATPNYAIGHKVYYKLVSPKDGSSITIEDPWEIASFCTKSSVEAATIVSYSSEYPIDLSDADLDIHEKAANAVTVSLNPEKFDGKVNNKLKPGFDYEISSVATREWQDELVVIPTISFASYTDRGMFTSRSSGQLSGSLDEMVVSPLVVNQSLQDSLVSQDKGGLCTNYTVSGYNYAGGTNKLAWSAVGYTASDISKQLGFCFKNCIINTAGRMQDISVVPSGDKIPFEVKKIVNAQGVEVERATDRGTYTITVSKSAAAPYKNLTCEDVEFVIEIVSSDLSLVSRTYPSGMSYRQLGADVTSSFTKSSGYAYTGDVVNPTLKLIDPLGTEIDSSLYTTVGVGVDVSSSKYAYSIAATDEAKASNLLLGQVSIPKVRGYKIVAADISSDNIEIRVDDATFTGSAVQPEVTFWDVSDAEHPVEMAYKLGQDYTLEYTNNIAIADKADEKAPSVTIKTKGSNMVAREVTVSFNIKGSVIDISSDSCKFEYSSELMVGAEPAVVGSYKPATEWTSLVQGEMFTVTVCSDSAGRTAVDDLSKLTEGSTVYYRVDGATDRSFIGSRVLGPIRIVAGGDSRSFETSKVGVGGNKLSVSIDSCTYTGTALTPTVVVKDGSKTLTLGLDYAITAYNDNVNVNGVNESKPTVTIIGLNGYSGSGEFGFTISPAKLADLCEASVVTSQVYTGSQIQPSSDMLSVTMDGSNLPSDGNWSIKSDGYGENVLAGEGSGSLILIGEGNFTGEMTVTFDIVGKALSENDFTVTVRSATYTGGAVTVDPFNIIVVERSTNLPLDPENDFTVVGYKDNGSVGTATINISGAGNYAGNISATFTIKSATFTADMVTLDETSYPAVSGGAHPGVNVKLGDVVLPETDYTVSYGTNDVAGEGTGTVTVAPSGNGNIVGEAVTLTFDVTDDIAAATIEVVKPASYGASGTIPPVLKVTYGAESRELVEGTDYEIEYRSGDKPGVTTALIVGKGLFEGSSQEFTYSVSDKVSRLFGETRYDTMSAIIESGFETSETVIVATGDNFPDALAASALAGTCNAPIVLTSSEGGLTDQAKNQITRLKATKAIVLGGTSAVSQQAQDNLVSLGLSVERIGGTSRQETALLVMECVAKEASFDTVVVSRSDSPWDSLSISPYSYAKHAPVVLAEADGTLSEATVSAIRASSASRVVIVGGTGAVSSAVESQLSGMKVERWSGESRYSTSSVIVSHELAEGMSASACAIATGEKFPDALAGGALVGSRNGVLMLASDEDSSAVTNLLSTQGKDVETCYLLGGTSAISAELESYVKSLV